MNALDKMETNTIEPASGKAKNMVIFLHGYGSNKDDLIGIGAEWAPEMPDTVFLSPNAPAPCDQMPMNAYQWFAIRANVDRATFEREQEAQSVAPLLGEYIDAQLEKWDVDESNLVIVGFSQGTMMAMYTMPRRKKPCAAIVGYSGMLIDAAGLKDDNVVKMPVLAIHGDSDDIVHPSNLQEVEEGFTNAGFNIETILRPQVAHGIDMFSIKRGLSFIKDTLEG